MGNKILLIEDDETFVSTLKIILRDSPIELVWAKTGAEGIQAYRKNIHSFATVIIDYCLPDLKGSEVGRHIKKLNPTQDILSTSGYQEPENLIDLLETGGARSFIFKGRPVEEIKTRILDSITIYENQTRLIGSEHAPSKIELELKAAGFIGRSANMHKVLEQIRKYKESPYPVLITGETGTGKELVAKALVPKGKNLIIINCPRFANAENMLESELFGYVKGAFTGAEKDNPGLLANANEQVVFLDELHELSFTAQTKLLRFLQEKKFRRVGDNSGREISIEFKLIAAAKPDIHERIQDKRFLEDLFHRVGQLQIHVPPLRERTEDIELLVHSVQDEFNAKQMETARKQVRISTIKELAKQPWAGNVRELQNVVRQILTDCDSDIVNPSDLAAFLNKKKSGDVVNLHGFSLENSLKKFEIDQIINSLNRSRTLNEAAERLEISRWTLARKLTVFAINPDVYLSKIAQ